MTTNTTAVVDLNNLVMITRHSELPKDKREKYAKELLFSKTIHFACNLIQQYSASNAIIACEGMNNWRKEYFPEYKANRETETDIYRDDIIETFNDLYEFFHDYTNLQTISCERAEADDVIAVTVQENPNQSFVILSADKDFVQLLRSNVRLYSPAQKKERTLDDDPEFFKFFKAIRGDTGDNIRSAYPRVREKKLREAWEDDYAMKNIMETVRKEDEKTVKEVYERNRTLTDLSRQPENIRQNIVTELQKEDQYNYNQMKTMRYLRDKNVGEYVEENFDKITPILKLK